MKKIISGFITLIVLLASNYFLAKLLKLPFLELSFMTGLILSIIIGFFSSEGGFTTEMTNTSIKRFMSSESRNRDHFVKFSMNTPFLVALVYTIISAIASVVKYWDYFV